MDTTALLQYLGLNPDEVKTLDDLKAKFPAQFVSRAALLDQRSAEFKEILPHVAGRVTGSITSALNRALEEVQLEVTPQEREGKKAEELVAYAITKLNARAGEKDSKLQELQAQLAKSKDEATRELTAKLEQEQRRRAEVEQLLGTTKTTLEQQRVDYEAKIKTTRLDYVRTDAHAKAIKWRTGIKPVEQAGFFAHLEKNYKLDLDDQGQLVPLTATGERVPSKKVVGAFMTYEEVLEQEGKTLGVWEENPHARHQAPAFVVTGAGTPPAAAGAGAPPAGAPRKVAPRVPVTRLR